MFILQTFIEPVSRAQMFYGYIYHPNICFDVTQNLVGDQPQSGAFMVGMVWRAVGV